MTSYEQIKAKIIATLMGRPAGTEIQPDQQQDYTLNMLDYTRSLELIATSTLMGIAEATTTPLQPDSSKVCYIAGIGQNRTVTFQNFHNQNGTPISITTNDMQGVFVILLWNQEYWSYESFETNIISHADNANFYYSYNIKKTYSSISEMNADKNNPVGVDGKYIKIGDIVTVVNSTTPTENGIYSYQGVTNDFKFQSSFNFQIEQVRSQNVNKSPSSKLFDDLADNDNIRLNSISKNIDITNSYLINLSGDIQSVPKGFCCSGFLNVKDCKDMVVKGYYANPPYQPISFYDKDKVYISSYVNYLSEDYCIIKNLTPPEGAEFLKINFVTCYN